MANRSAAPLTMRKCLQYSKMLVPKMACDENGWHVQWPKSHPHVVYANTYDELVPALATWMQQLGELGNYGPHVDPENGCTKCGVSYVKQRYAEGLKIK